MRNANIDVGQWVKMKVIGGMALWREKVRGEYRIDISSCSLDICEVKMKQDTMSVNYFNLSGNASSSNDFGSVINFLTNAVYS